MLRHSTFGMALFINILIICLWHFISYIISGNIKPQRVDYKQKPYKISKLEQKGNFYIENFFIDKWYMLLPTSYNSVGIDVESVKSIDTLTLKSYLTLTCRSELFSRINFLYIICACVLDAPYLAFILGIFVILINLPFFASSRYCRCIILNELLSRRNELNKKDNSISVFDIIYSNPR